MNDWHTYFKNKKITVMGLGLLGRGIGDIKFLAEQGAKLVVTDLKSEEELAPALVELSAFSDIEYHLGGHRMEDFEGRDFILKASGVPLDSPYIAHARKSGVPIEMSIALFARFFRGPIVGVTGSLGKTTTTHLIEHILRESGRKTILGGNVRGGSTLALLPEATSDSIAVLELDSWSLQGFGEAKISPAVSVFTLFVPDHMNYYHGDMDTYLADKANIFLNQTPEDTLVCGEQVAPIVKENYARHVRSRLVVAKASAVSKSWKLRIPGEHNRANAACAIEAVRALGVDEEAIKAAVESFPGVSGRLYFVAEKNGVSIYNDTAATLPLSAASGITALDEVEKKNVVVIAGGADKDLDPTPLVEALRAHAKTVILLPGTGSDKLRPLLAGMPMIESADLSGAISAAMEAAAPGDTVTLSPGFASFGLFKNMYDRGDQFEKLVAGL